MEQEKKQPTDLVLRDKIKKEVQRHGRDSLHLSENQNSTILTKQYETDFKGKKLVALVEDEWNIWGLHDTFVMVTYGGKEVARYRNASPLVLEAGDWKSYFPKH